MEGGGGHESLDAPHQTANGVVSRHERIKKEHQKREIGVRWFMLAVGGYAGTWM